MPVKKYLKESIKLGDKDLTVETGRVAKQADGSLVIQYGDTMLLVAAVSAPHAREGIDFFPLTVEYREANFAAGRIPGNYFRREGRPTEKEVLTSRLIDRPCRPLFAEGFRNETQVVASVISADPDNNPDVIAITGASCALYLSDIPFLNPIAGVRIGLIEGRYIVNPTYDEVRESRLNLIVAGTEEAIVMVEAGASEVSEEIMVEALMLAHKEINRLCRWQKELYKALDVKKREVDVSPLNEEMVGEIERNYADRMRSALDTTSQEKRDSYAAIDALKKEVVEGYPEDQVERRQMAKLIFDHLKEKIFRDDILNNRRRPGFRRSVLSASKLPGCHEYTVQLCSRAVRRRRSSRRPWAPRKTSSLWMILKRVRSNDVFCFTTTSRITRLARSDDSDLPADAKSATGPSRDARSKLYYLTSQNFPTQSGSCRTSRNRTVLHRWPVSAVALFP
jgi:polyribonucleotide nucleotidyltransferase